MKRVYLGNKELTTIATVTNGGGGGDDTKKWVDYFNGTLTEFTVPEGVTKIGNYAFSNCSKLTGITIPDGVTKIGDSAFSNCSKLTGITIPDGVTKIGNSAFSNCSKLTGITIPDSVTNIDNNVFYFCSSLTGITIPDGVTKIGNFAFSNCSKLTGITIPDGVTSIGVYAFYDSGLKEMTVNATTPPSLGNNAMPKNISVIYVPSSSVDAYKSASGWKDYASKIQAMPSMKVTYIDGTQKVFTGLTSISSSTDSNKRKAKEVIIYDGVTGIYYGAFQYCQSLTSIKLPNSLKSIKGYAFAYSSSLTDIIIPANVTEISDNAFEGCSSLASVTIQKSTSKYYYGFDTFKGISSSAKLYVPSNLLSEYQADSAWTGAFGGGIFAIQ